MRAENPKNPCMRKQWIPSSLFLNPTHKEKEPEDEASYSYPADLMQMWQVNCSALMQLTKYPKIGEVMNTVNEIMPNMRPITEDGVPFFAAFKIIITSYI